MMNLNGEVCWCSVLLLLLSFSWTSGASGLMFFILIYNTTSWSSASRMKPPASALPASDIISYRTSSGICILLHSGTGLTFTKTVQRLKGAPIHPARPCYRCGGETPCTFILLVVERHPAHSYCLWWRDTLHVHIYSLWLCYSILTLWCWQS